MNNPEKNEPRPKLVPAFARRGINTPGDSITCSKPAARSTTGAERIPDEPKRTARNQIIEPTAMRIERTCLQRDRQNASREPNPH